jgi:hypothetical protein
MCLKKNVPGSCSVVLIFMVIRREMDKSNVVSVGCCFTLFEINIAEVTT